MFGALGPPSTAGIYLASLDSDTTTRLTGVAGSAQYIPTGWLLFLRQATTLVAQRLDVARSTLVGDAVNVADPVAAVGNAAVYASGFSVSTTGLIAYRSAVVARRQLVWFDRTGKVLNTFGPVDESGLSAPKLSPDDRRVAVARAQQGNADIWLQDGMRSVRFTFDPAAEAFPLWSPDGREILFDSNRKGQRDLYRKPASGGGMEELLFESPQNKAINDWSADGRFILFLSNDPQKTARDLWVLPMTGDRKPYPFLKTNFDEWRGRFSPDGRWVAYQSNESGRHEIYVRPFPGPGGQWQISTAGGISPTWSRNGAELYYVAPDAKLMAAPIHATGSTLEPGTPVALFQTRMVGGGSELSQGYQYDVSRDGRFLINVTADEGNTSPITVILNWAGLKP